MNLGCGSDLSLLVRGAINVKCLERWDRSRWEEVVVDKGRVDEVSCSSTVYEGSGGNGSRSIL